METRVHKLLILAGEEGVDLEARDFKKLSEVIVNEYLSQPNPTFKVVPNSLSSVPHRYHDQSCQQNPTQIPPLRRTHSRHGQRILRSCGKNLIKRGGNSSHLSHCRQFQRNSQLSQLPLRNNERLIPQLS